MNTGGYSQYTWPPTTIGLDGWWGGTRLDGWWGLQHSSWWVMGGRWSILMGDGDCLVGGLILFSISWQSANLNLKKIAGPLLPPRIERRGTIRHGCTRRIRRRMKHAAPPRHREARRLDREAPGSTGKHREALVLLTGYCCSGVPTRAAGQLSIHAMEFDIGPARGQHASTGMRSCCHLT